MKKIFKIFIKTFISLSFVATSVGATFGLSSCSTPPVVFENMASTYTFYKEQKNDMSVNVVVTNIQEEINIRLLDASTNFEFTDAKVELTQPLNEKNIYRVVVSANSIFSQKNLKMEVYSQDKSWKISSNFMLSIINPPRTGFQNMHNSYSTTTGKLLETTTNCWVEDGTEKITAKFHTPEHVIYPDATIELTEKSFSGTIQYTFSILSNKIFSDVFLLFAIYHGKALLTESPVFTLTITDTPTATFKNLASSYTGMINTVLNTNAIVEIKYTTAEVTAVAILASDESKFTSVTVSLTRVESESNEYSISLKSATVLTSTLLKIAIYEGETRLDHISGSFSLVFNEPPTPTATVENLLTTFKSISTNNLCKVVFKYIDDMARVTLNLEGFDSKMINVTLVKVDSDYFIRAITECVDVTINPTGLSWAGTINIMLDAKLLTTISNTFKIEIYDGAEIIIDQKSSYISGSLAENFVVISLSDSASYSFPIDTIDCKSINPSGGSDSYYLDKSGFTPTTSEWSMTLPDVTTQASEKIWIKVTGTYTSIITSATKNICFIKSAELTIITVPESLSIKINYPPSETADGYNIAIKTGAGQTKLPQFEISGIVPSKNYVVKLYHTDKDSKEVLLTQFLIKQEFSTTTPNLMYVYLTTSIRYLTTYTNVFVTIYDQFDKRVVAFNTAGTDQIFSLSSYNSTIDTLKTNSLNWQTAAQFASIEDIQWIDSYGDPTPSVVVVNKDGRMDSTLTATYKIVTNSSGTIQLQTSKNIPVDNKFTFYVKFEYASLGYIQVTALVLENIVFTAS